MTPWVLRTVVVVSLVAGGVACGSGDEVVVPTAAELAENLIDVDTFEGAWTVNVPPDSPDAAISGIVPEEMRGMLPSIDLCEQASEASRAAADDLEWMAFRQIDLDVEDSINPPNDLTGHIVFAQEFLSSGEPGDEEELFDLLRDGLEACLGEIPAGEEGPGTTEEFDMPDVGDDRWGMTTVIDEAGGWAEWRIHTGLIRDRAVLAMITVGEIRANTEPYYTMDEVGDMMTTAFELLEPAS
jgi:hypothetical protein